MSAVNEKRIVCKVVESGDVALLRDRGVTGEWFSNDTHRQAIEFILAHHDKYGVVVGRATFETQMGSSYGLVSVKESLEYLLDKQAEAVRWQTIQKMLPAVEDALDRDDTATDAVAAAREALNKIDVFDSPNGNHLVDLMSTQRLDAQWEDYERREKGGGLLGYSSGFPTIDATTLGLQDGQLITVLAQPKVGKTTICLTMANHVYVEHKQPILFVSFEMGVREIELRQASTMAKINFKHLQQAKLSPLEKKRYAEYLDRAEDEFDLPFHFMDAAGGATVGAVRSHIEKTDPGLVVVDGIYMMTDEVTGEANTPQALTNITRALKRLAAQTHKPILINTQALAWKSKGTRISMDSAGYSSSFAQDSDIILGLEKIQPSKGEEETESHSYQRILKILAGRNVGFASVDLDFDYDEGRIEEAP